MSKEKPGKPLLEEVRRLENALDVFNIRIQRQLAESDLAKEQKKTVNSKLKRTRIPLKRMNTRHRISAWMRSKRG